MWPLGVTPRWPGLHSKCFYLLPHGPACYPNIFLKDKPAHILCLFFFYDFSSCFTISDPASNNSLGWGSIGQLVESLFSTHKILDSSPCTSGTVCGACVLAIQALRRWMWGGIGGGGLGDQEFRVLLGYILGLKPAWATRYPISKKCK